MGLKGMRLPLLCVCTGGGGFASTLRVLLPVLVTSCGDSSCHVPAPESFLGILIVLRDTALFSRANSG